ASWLRLVARTRRSRRASTCSTRPTEPAQGSSAMLAPHSGRMTQQRTQAAKDARLWQRLLLVALTGAMPLFVVAVLLLHATYSTTIDFAKQERRGVAFQSRLDGVLEAAARHLNAARSSAGEPE